MGTGFSKDMEYGVPSNPRVDFAVKRSRKENRMVRIDNCPLVQLPDSTLRYRYQNKAAGNQVNQIPREKPHEGIDLAEKYNYFIHHKSNGDSNEDTGGNYFYVYKGPERARQKHIYYVFGKGLNVQENGFVESNYKPEEQSFNRPIFYKTHGHIYMDLIILKKGKLVDETHEKPETSDENHSQGDGDKITEVVEDKSPQHMELNLPVMTKISEIKIQMAKKFSTVSPHIHLYLLGTELRPEQKLKDITVVQKGVKQLKILLKLK